MDKKKKTVKQFKAEALRRIKAAYGNDVSAFDFDTDELKYYMNAGYEDGADWVDNMAAKYEIPRADEVTCPMAIAVLSIEVGKIKDKKHPAKAALKVLQEFISEKYN